jgi:tRNA threonylcarbamoyladenosine biosynthesis protein TsaE
MTVTHDTHGPKETEALAAKLAAALPGGMLISLSGELGAGKTCFVRGLARGLGVPKDVMITSPTYVLQHIYRGGRLTVYHIDAYRLRGGADEFEASGLQECLLDPNGIVCMEWPECAGESGAAREWIEISIEHVDPETRRLTFTAHGVSALLAVAVCENEKIAVDLEPMILETVDLRSMELDPVAIQMLSREMCVEHKAIPVGYQSNVLTFAISDPLDMNPVDCIRFMVNCEVKPVLASADAIQSAIEKYYGKS